MRFVYLAASKPYARTVQFQFIHQFQRSTNLTSAIGHVNLPSSCPVCEHSPLSAEDCNPNKSLRTTIKVFIRTAEKKREAQRNKEAKETPPITPVDAAKPNIPDAEASAPAPTAEGQGEVVAEQQDEATKSAPLQADTVVPIMTQAGEQVGFASLFSSYQTLTISGRGGKARRGRRRQEGAVFNRHSARERGPRRSASRTKRPYRQRERRQR